MGLHWLFSKGNCILRGEVEEKMRGFAIVRMMGRRGADQVLCQFRLLGALGLHWLCTTINYTSHGKDVREIQRFGGRGHRTFRLHLFQARRPRRLHMRILRTFPRPSQQRLQTAMLQNQLRTDRGNRPFQNPHMAKHLLHPRTVKHRLLPLPMDKQRRRREPPPMDNHQRPIHRTFRHLSRVRMVTHLLPVHMDTVPLLPIHTDNNPLLLRNPDNRFPTPLMGSHPRLVLRTGNRLPRLGPEGQGQRLLLQVEIKP